MKKNFEFRKLTRAEIKEFHSIDRTETIDSIYYMRDGVLVSEQEHHQVPDWSLDEKKKRITALKAFYDEGATFFGAFSGDDLVGMSVLDHNLVRSGDQRLNLKGLWVSHIFRGKGIGAALFQLAVGEARDRKAKTLYVSATPSENTVHFYMGLGCKLADPIDRYLYEEEPEDIHLELLLGSNQPEE